MIGSKLYKFDIIVNRVEGLLKTGAIAYESRPLWYDIYKAFPPEVTPDYLRPKPELQIKKILYKEDVDRAAYYKLKNRGVANLLDPSLDQSLPDFEDYLACKK